MDFLNRLPRPLKRFYEFMEETLSNWSLHNVPRLASSFSFYAILSLAPLLVIAVRIAGTVLGPGEALNSVIRQAKDAVGEDASELLRTLIENTRSSRAGGIATGLSVVITFFSASNLFLQLEDAVNTIWSIEQKGNVIKRLIFQRLLAFLAVLVFGGALISWLMVDSAMGILSRSNGKQSYWPLVSFLVTSLFLTGIFGLSIRAYPKGLLKWRDVLPGALVAGVGVALGKLVLSAYWQLAFGPAAAYGAAGSLVVLLLWVYYTSQIYFFGIELTHTFARWHGSQRPSEGTEPKEAEPKEAEPE